MNKKNKNKAGFSLVELLVVIAIIGVLATLAVISLQQARKSARDAKRIADIKQIQTALELYFNDWQEYPAASSVTSTIASGSNIYMAVLPTAPSPADGSCTANQNSYDYAPTSTDNGSYTLSFCLGGQVGGLDDGPKCAHPGGVSDQDCSQ